MNDAPLLSSANPSPRGFVKLQRSETTDALLHDLNALHLLTVIAYRARWRDGESLDGLRFGQALVGDYKAIGMTEKSYRKAKERLGKWKLASFKGTPQGTIATLTDSRVFGLNDERYRPEMGERKGERMGELFSGGENAFGANDGANVRATKGRTKGGQGASNEEGKEGKERKNTNPHTGAGDLDPGVSKVTGRPKDFDEWAVYGATLDPAWPVQDLRASFDHYEANGWRQSSGNVIKNWHAACRTCHRRWQQRAPQTGNAYVPGANRHQMPAATDADHAKGFFHGTEFEGKAEQL